MHSCQWAVYQVFTEKVLTKLKNDKKRNYKKRKKGGL